MGIGESPVIGVGDLVWRKTGRALSTIVDSQGAARGKFMRIAQKDRLQG